mgnify:CR=1 FL=1
MKKYKINRDNKEFKLPSKKEMLKHKNFNKVQVNYNDITKRNKTPLYKNRKIFLFIVLLILIFYLILNA